MSEEGRTPTPWLLKNMHRISTEDFYNAQLSESDLMRLYPGSEENPFKGFSEDLKQELDTIVKRSVSPVAAEMRRRWEGDV